jgi:arylsulfatase A-like enzyme
MNIRFCIIFVLCSVATVKAAPPNVILIMPDDMGYGDLTCHGNPHIKTPNLDRLHRESLRFTDFHVSPTCAPTRSAILTGRHEFYNGVTHTIFERERLRLDAITLPEVLRGNGYTTGLFGKWHLGDEDNYQPQKRGFDEVYIHGAGGIGQSYPGSCGDAPGNKYMNPVLRHNGTFLATQGYCTDLFFAQATRWIGERRGQKPFFVMITPNAPHAPLDAPEGSTKPYEGKVPQDVAKFYGMIENIDTNVGRLLTQLENWKLDQDTIIIFLTDNGTATGAKIFNAGMRGQKGSPWEGGTRVPSFWRWPGKFQPKDIPTLTCHWDIAPTLLDLTVTKHPAFQEQIRGRSLRPWLAGEAIEWPSRHFITHVGRWEKGQAANAKFTNASIRDEKHSLVFLPKSPAQLFDLRADPGQTKNLANERPEVVESLRGVYDKWWDDVQPHLVNETAIGPKMNPFHTAYWKQFNGPGPNNVPPR